MEALIGPELADGLNPHASRGVEMKMDYLEKWVEIGMPWELADANEKILMSEPVLYRKRRRPEPSSPASICKEGDTGRSGSYIGSRRERLAASGPTAS